MSDKYVTRMDNKYSDPDLLRAEATLQLQHTSTTETVIRTDAELLFELRLHQTELEMQNDELLRTYLALEESRDRYLDLYDFSPIAYLTLSENELITEANLTTATLLGLELNKLINSRFACYVAREDGDSWYHYFRQAKKSVSKNIFELTLRKVDGTPFYARLDCLPFGKDNEPMMLRVAIIDITERKQAEEVLRIDAVAFNTHDGIIVTDARKIILRANQAFCHITGYNPEEIIGNNPSFLHSGLHDDAFYKAIWTSLEHEGQWQGEMWGRGKDDKTFPLWVTINPVTDKNNGLITYYVGSFTDITALKLAERILLDASQQLEKQVITTQRELKKNTEESQELNAALNILLRRQQADRIEDQSAISNQIKGSVSPFLEKLKKASSNTNQTNLLTILENNLAHLIKTYGDSSTFTSIYQLLTPIEIQVASLIRQGYSTKNIALSLFISSGTVNIHRKHIRKKLGLNGKPTNLTSYLMALVE
jgi:PAS domain S-box-containing protein